SCSSSYAVRRRPRARSNVPGSSCDLPAVRRSPRSAGTCRRRVTPCASGSSASARSGSRGCTTFRAPAARRSFPPEVALHVVKIACERPDLRGRSLSTWDCTEIARELIRSGVVAAISAQTVQRILAHHTLKPWRTHLWLSPKAPRDAAFVDQVHAICELYTRPLAPDEVVLSVDEKTSIQPRPRLAPTTAAAPGRAGRVEHEYKRAGAVNLLAAFDTRTGKVV